MLYEKEKLEQYFRDEIRRVSEQQIEELNEEIAEIQEKTIKDIEVSAKHDVDLACDQEMKELQSEYAIRQSRLHDETDRQLMKKRNELAEMIFHDVIEKIKDFTSQDAYETLLCSRAKELASKQYPSSTIYLREEDMQYADAIQKEFKEGTNVQADESIQYGGFRLECIENGIIIDETFDSALNEQKEWFYQNSGLFVK